MRILVGGRELITSASLLVPVSEEAWIEFTAGTWNVRVKIIFVEDKENIQSQFFLTAESDHASLKVTNWNNSLPMSSPELVHLGKTEGKDILLMFSGYSIGDMKKLDISFFWEKPNDK